MLLEEVPVHQASIAEAKWIEHYHAAGARLTNLRPPGATCDQSTQWLDPEARRQKLKEARLQQQDGPFTQAAREKMSAALKERWANDPNAEQRKKKLAEQGRQSIAKAQARSREVWQGRKHTPETREKLRQAHLGRPRTPAEIAARIRQKEATTARKVAKKQAREEAKQARIAGWCFLRKQRVNLIRDLDTPKPRRVTSEETKAKIREARARQAPMTPEARAKLSEARRREWAEGSRSKEALAEQGRRTVSKAHDAWRGQRHSDASIAKMSQARRRGPKT